MNPHPAQLTGEEPTRPRPDTALRFGGLTTVDAASAAIVASSARQNERFRSFSELAAVYTEGVDFSRTAVVRRSPFAVVAPHGGNIEPGTSEFARMLADGLTSFYAFESRLPEANQDVHLTSARFDDPLCLDVVSISRIVITVHGCRGDYEGVFIGGRDARLGNQILGALKRNDIPAARDIVHPGMDALNICNRGGSHAGVQIEITRGTRQPFIDDRHRHNPDPFCNSLPYGLRAVRIIRDIIAEASGL